MSWDEKILQSQVEQVFWGSGTASQEGLLYSGGLSAVLRVHSHLYNNNNNNCRG